MSAIMQEWCSFSIQVLGNYTEINQTIQKSNLTALIC